MNIDSILNGIVIDHITAKKGMAIYKYLRLDELDSTVAMIRNVKSGKMGRKDIIKIDEDIDIDLDVLGYIDPGATVNIIREGRLVGKKRLELPEKLCGVIKCNNPRCITSTEQEIEHIFELHSKDAREYRCAYCEAARQ